MKRHIRPLLCYSSQFPTADELWKYQGGEVRAHIELIYDNCTNAYMRNLNPNYKPYDSIQDPKTKLLRDNFFELIFDHTSYTIVAVLRELNERKIV